MMFQNGDDSAKLILRMAELMPLCNTTEAIAQGNFEHSLRILGERKPDLLNMLDEPEETLTRLGYFTIARNHRTVKAEVSFPKIHGAPGVFRLTASPLYDEKGQLAGAIESVQDITHLKNIEQELKETREKYRQLLERNLPK